MMRATSALERRVTYYENQMLRDWLRKFRKSEKG
jgi:hypothetical protein